MFAQNAYHLYAARFLLGFGGAASFAVIPVFVSEIADKEFVSGHLVQMCLHVCYIIILLFAEFVVHSALWSALAATWAC